MYCILFCLEGDLHSHIMLTHLMSFHIHDTPDATGMKPANTQTRISALFIFHPYLLFLSRPPPYRFLR
jgi:hypothetical protein